MALSVATGSITLTAASVATTTFTVSGLSFQPKAILFFWSGRGTTGQAEQDHLWGTGIATGTASRRAYSTQSDHTPTTMAADCIWRNDACVATMDIAGAIVGLADLNAINSDGFQLIIDDQFPADLLVGWIAWGGADLTNAEIVDFVTPAATGNQDVATSFALNTGLDDKAVIIMGGVLAAVNTRASYSTWSLGVAAGDTPVSALMCGASSDAVGTSVTCSYSRTGDVLAEASDDTVVYRASLSAWLSTGFRLNYTTAAVDRRFSALVMKGGRWQVGDNVTSTGTTNQVESTTYVPKGLLVGSHNKAASVAGTTQAHDERSLGAADSATSRVSASIMDKDASTLADVGVAFNTDAMYSNQSTAATIAIEGLMDLVSFDATPSFTYVMDDADPVASYFFYLLAADTPGGGGGPVLNDHNWREIGRGVMCGVGRGAL